jgi:NADP-dependent 3-hydroxy acid dehydrogenase YdfG
MADRVREKVALITGAGSGIGRATALLFAVEGAKVAALDLNREGAAETARLVEERGGEAIALTADVSREEEVVAAVEATVARFGRLDVLVASAGIDLFVRATDTNLEDWERVQSIDLRGVYLCCKHVIPHMERAGGGAIVTLSSVNGLIGVPVHAAYAAAKGGVIALTRQLAVHLPHHYRYAHGAGVHQRRHPGDAGAYAPPAAHRPGGGRGLRRALPGLGRGPLRDGRDLAGRLRLDGAVGRAHHLNATKAS